MFDNIDSLSEALNHEFKVVSEASIKHEEEGAVLYFVRRGLKDDAVISLSKLKTLEYRIFRKLREKLRNFWAKHENIQSWNASLQSEYDKSFGTFIKESKELIQSYRLPLKFEFYEEFADHAYNTVQNDISYYEKLCSYYVEFLEGITNEFNYDPKIFSSLVFTNKVRKTYAKVAEHDLMADNGSWTGRESNASYYERPDSRKGPKRSPHKSNQTGAGYATKSETKLGSKPLPIIL